MSLSRKPLSSSEIAEKLKGLKGWAHKESFLAKDFTFKNFVEAFSFMTAVGLEAEKLDHHPDWSNVYNRVSIRLNTHDAKGITEFDFELAKKIEAIA